MRVTAGTRPRGLFACGMPATPGRLPARHVLFSDSLARLLAVRRPAFSGRPTGARCFGWRAQAPGTAGSEAGGKTGMRNRRGGESETYHLTCPVCGALPGTSCLEDYQELERIHPSRRMSVAERNRRHAASGWEPPELAERRLTKRNAEAASAPRLGLGPRGQDTGPQAARDRPGAVPGNMEEREGADLARCGCTGRGRRGRGRGRYCEPGGDDGARGWFAGYLGRFPQDAVVPRWKLRNIATAIWLDIDDGPLPLSRARQLHRRMAGHRGSSKGRRSSQKLADHLRDFEELGLIRRDHAQDAVIVTNPIGLLTLAGVPAAPRPEQRRRR